MIHKLSDVQSQNIGNNTNIWQFCVVLSEAVIGDNCNICSHCFIENDVKIGNNVTIGANTTVTKSIPDNCVVCGNPARIINQNGEKVNIKL